MTWAQHPIIFAMAITAATFVGLATMLADAAAWKAAGFVLAAGPVGVGLARYLAYRRRG